MWRQGEYLIEVRREDTEKIWAKVKHELERQNSTHELVK